MSVQGAKLSLLQNLCAFFVVIFLASGSGFIALAQSADEAILRSMTARYFEFYQKKDAAALLQMWSDKSPDYTATQQSLQKLFAETAKLELKNLSIGKVSIEGDKASVRVAFDLSAIGTQTGKPAPGFGKQNRTISFSRVGKQWQVWRVISSEEELAAMIGASQTDEERKAIVENNQELLTHEFIITLNKYARQRFDKGKLTEALSLYNFAVTVAEKIGDLSGKSDALRLIGLYHAKRIQPDQALQYYQESLTLAQKAGDKEMTAKAFNSLGIYYVKLKDNKQALDYFQQVKKIAEELQDDYLLLAALNNFTLIYATEGRHQENLDTVIRLLSIAKKLDMKPEICGLMNNVGIVYKFLLRYDEAQEHLQKGLICAEQYGYKQEMVVSRTHLAEIYNKKSMYLKAIEEAEALKILAEEMDDKGSIAFALTTIALNQRTLGEPASAIENYQKSLDIMLELNSDQILTSTIYINLAGVYFDQGDYVKALDYIKRSLALSEKIEDQEGVVIATYMIGSVYMAQENYSQALTYYQRGLQLAEKSDDKTEVVRILLNIGVLYTSQKNYAKAQKHFEEVLILSKSLADKSVLIRNLQYLGDVHSELQNYEKALEYYLQAGKISEEILNKLVPGTLLHAIGTIYYQQKDYAKALEYANRAASIARKMNNPTEIWPAELLTGKVYRALNQSDQALQSFSESIATIEQLREHLIGGENERQRFLENKIEAYDETIDLLLSEKKLAQALAYAEQFKGRVLLDALQNARVNVSKAMSVQEQEKERQLKGGLISLNSQISQENQKEKSDEAKLKNLNLQLQKARQEYEDFQFNLYVSHPELKTQRGQMQPVTLNDVNALLPDEKTALLEFVVKDEKAFLFVITRKTDLQKKVATQVNSPADHVDLQVYPLNIKQKDLQSLTQTFVQAISIRSAGYKESAAKLYNTLLKPAQAQLKTINNLIVVPDNVLWELPFQALQSALNRFLVQDYAISYAPSLTVLREMNRKKKSPTQSNETTLLALGNPDIGQETKSQIEAVYMGEKLDPLPEAERQVKALAQLYGSTQSNTYVGVEAKEERVKQEASHYKILHLATHGILNNASPMYSHLVLSQSPGDVNEDGLLEAWEIMKLDLNADLVVLSACDTARGKVSAGEGVIGLSWALFVAGCPSVVVSQWNVESSSTTELMLEFHRRLKGKSGERQGKASQSQAVSSKSEALRQASLKLLKSPQYRHPFYWAAFVVVGDNSWK